SGTLPASSSGRSVRSAAVQLGSSPTTGTPAVAYGARIRAVRRNTRRAIPSWPVLTQVSPQQTGRGGSSTAYPAARSTRTAATATCGSKYRVNVSGNSTTRRPPPLLGPLVPATPPPTSPPAP